MRDLKVCLTPDLFHYYNHPDQIVVVVDILRATSVISTAFHYGIRSVIPVSSVEETSLYIEKIDHIIAAERNAMPLPGFDYGNSPFQYMNSDIYNKVLVLTTTNGTKSIRIAEDYDVITACYINLDAVCKFLLTQKKDVLILCSAWKGLINLEDSIFAGNLSKLLLESSVFRSSCDSTILSINLCEDAGDNLFEYLRNSSHRMRLKGLNMEKDTRFCLSPDINSDIIPMLSDGKLSAYNIRE